MRMSSRERGGEGGRRRESGRVGGRQRDREGQVGEQIKGEGEIHIEKKQLLKPDQMLQYFAKSRDPDLG